MRLTAKTLKTWREARLDVTGGKCELCGLPVRPTDPAVGDHDHKTGQMRGVLHRSCNALLGNIENNKARYGLRDMTQLALMLRGVVPYIMLRRPDDTPLYPTHRTDEEKRVARNKKAAKARAAKKEASK